MRSWERKGCQVSSDDKDKGGEGKGGNLNKICYKSGQIRASGGGRLYLEIPQNGLFWPETQLKQIAKTCITFCLR